MARYLKDSQRLTVKFLDGDTNEQLFEIPNRNLMDIRDFFSDAYVNQLVMETMKEKDLPSSIIVLVLGEYKLR